MNERKLLQWWYKVLARAEIDSNIQYVLNRLEGLEAQILDTLWVIESGNGSKPQSEERLRRETEAVIDNVRQLVYLTEADWTRDEISSASIIVLEFVHRRRIEREQAR